MCVCIYNVCVWTIRLILCLPVRVVVEVSSVLVEISVYVCFT